MIKALLPIWAQFPTLLLLCVVLWRAMKFTDNVSARFVIAAIWVRLVLSAFHVLTYQNIAAGLSINALGSIATVLIGIALARKSLLLSTASIPVMPLMIAIVLSATVNSRLAESVDTLTKFAYAMVLAIHTFEAIRLGHGKQMSKGLLLAFSPQLVFQAVSVLLGVKNISDFDQSVNYIGGYWHESAFSVGLFGFLISVIMGMGLPFRQRGGAFLIGAVGLLLANYRTAIAAAAPMFGYFALLTLNRLFPRHLRTMIAIACGMLLLAGGVVFVGSSERFGGLATSAEFVADGLRPTKSFTREEKDILTGRVYIWVNYFEGWQRGDSLHRTFGFGPDSWKGRYPLYAHNTFIHYLFELGVIGELGLLFFFGSVFFMGVLGTVTERWKLASIYASFFILNFATMPLWQIEGLIATGLLWGWSAASFSLRRRDVFNVKPAEPRPAGTQVELHRGTPSPA